MWLLFGHHLLWHFRFLSHTTKSTLKKDLPRKQLEPFYISLSCMSLILLTQDPPAIGIPWVVLGGIFIRTCTPHLFSLLFLLKFYLSLDTHHLLNFLSMVTFGFLGRGITLDTGPLAGVFCIIHSSPANFWRYFPMGEVLQGADPT